MPEHNIINTSSTVASAANTTIHHVGETGQQCSRPDIEGTAIRRTLSMLALIGSVFSLAAYVFFVNHQPQQVTPAQPDWFMIA